MNEAMLPLKPGMNEAMLPLKPGKAGFPRKTLLASLATAKVLARFRIPPMNNIFVF